MRSVPAAFLPTTALLVVLHGATADAQVNDPRVGQARTACLAGDPAKGLRVLAELYTETRDPIWVYNQARCLQQNRSTEDALARFKEYLRMNDTQRPELVKAARIYAQELETEIAARREREAAARAATQAAPPAASTAPEPPPGLAPAAPTGDDAGVSRQTLRRTGLVMGAVGAGALIAGAVLSIKVKALAQEVADAPAGTPASDLQAKVDRGERLEAWQWVSYATGGVLLAGCVVFYVTGKRAADGVPSEQAEHSALIPAPMPVSGGLVAIWQGRF